MLPPAASATRLARSVVAIRRVAGAALGVILVGAAMGCSADAASPGAASGGDGASGDDGAASDAANALATVKCGDAPTTMPKPGGGTWTCTFDDEFNELALSTTKWSVVTTAQSGFHNGDECYTPAGVKLTKGDYLTLTVSKAKSSSTCVKSASASFDTPYTSGMVTSAGKFSQTYGRFEISARFKQTYAVHPALWMLPEHRPDPQPWWGEIDIMESYGINDFASPGSTYNDRGNIWSTVHWMGANAGPNGAPAHVHPTFAQKPWGNDPAESQFHVYAVEWLPSGITFSVDGKAIKPIVPGTSASPSPSGGTLGVGAPFNATFYVNLELALDFNPNFPPPDPRFYEHPNDADLPSTLDIDYVRVWK